MVMNANELTALISECLRETDDHEFFLKLESVLRQQQAEIKDLQQQVAFLEDWRDVWAPVIRQHQGLDK
jgi:hypothetical protein